MHSVDNPRSLGEDALDSLREPLASEEQKLPTDVALVIKQWADWLQQIQFPFDFSFREGDLPRYVLRPLAEAWRAKDDQTLSVDEWETVILDESQDSWQPETA